ncbi:MAG: hypothetical protein C0483_15010 [Pirellula sp.]|nr:hypothetical protein [Pirellula sp.]
MEAIFFFFLGLAAFAAIGHGIWVAAAAVLRAITGTAAPTARNALAPAATTVETCPICTTPLLSDLKTCQTCGWPNVTTSDKNRRAIALAALRRSAKRFFGMGWLDQATYVTLEQTFDGAPTASSATPAATVAPIPLAPDAAAATTTEQPEAALEPVKLAPEPIAPQPSATQPSATQPSATQPAAPVEPVAPVPPMPVAAAPQTEPKDAPKEVPERVAAYVASRRTEDAKEPQPRASNNTANTSSPLTPHPSPPPRKLFASFLEEKNIRWGELIGGLLILCSSIALVLSFWQQIAERPLLKFSLFNGVTAALFGIGLYVHRRWRLPTTTHGLLLISMLLVPLNFLAIAAFTLENPPTDALTLGGEFASLALFAWLTYQAALVVVPSAALPVAVALIGCSAWQLIVRRFAGAEMGSPLLWALGLPPVVGFALPVGLQLRRLGRSEECGEREANLLFQVVGTTLFAALLPLGLLLAKSEQFTLTLARLAPLASMLAAPLLAAGLLLWRRLQDPELLKERIAGTALAVAGMGAMTAAVAVAWPIPAGMLPVALVNAAVFTWVALRSSNSTGSGIGAAHLPAALCGAAAYLVGLHVWQGRLAWNGTDVHAALHALVSGASGTALVIPVVLFAAVSLLLRRITATAPFKHPEATREEFSLLGAAHAASPWYAAAAGLVAGASIALLAVFSFRVPGDPFYAAHLFALYAVGAVVVAGATGRAEAAYVGAVLLWGALVQALRYRYFEHFSLENVWPIIFLSHASLALLAATFARRGGARWREAVGEPLGHGAAITSVLAVPLVLHAMLHGAPLQAAAYTAWLAGCWGALFLLTCSVAWFALFQIAALVALGNLVHHYLARQRWYELADGYSPLVDPRALQAFGLTTLAFGAGWLALRLFLKRRAAASRWAVVVCASPSVDRLAARAAGLLAVALALYAVVPGACQELSVRTFRPPEPRWTPAITEFQIAEIPHEPARALGGWLLLAAAAGLVVASFWERFQTSKVVALALLGAAASPLVAARWDVETAAATALLWSSAGALPALMLPLWFRRPLASWADRASWPQWHERDRDLPWIWFGTATTTALLPPIGFLVGLALTSAGRYLDIPNDLQQTLRLTSPEELMAALFACAIIAAVGLGAATLARVVGRKFAKHDGTDWTALGSTVVGLVAAAPLVATSIYFVASALVAFPILGPDPNSFFARSGLAVSYAVPLLAVAGTLVGCALSLRSAPLGFAAALVVNLAATAGYILAQAPTGLSFDLFLWLRLGQLNTAVSALFSVAWALGARRQAAVSSQQSAVRSSEAWLTTLTALAGAFCAAGILASVAALLAEPVRVQNIPTAVTDDAAWASFVCVLLAIGTYFRAMRRPITPAAWTCAALGAAALSALYTLHWDTGNLLAAGALVDGWLAVAYGALAAGWCAERSERFRFAPPASAARWSTFAGFLALAAAQVLLLHFVFGAFHSGTARLPHARFLAVTLLLVPLAIALAAWVGSRWRLYAAAALTCYGLTLFWFYNLGTWIFPEFRNDDTFGLALFIAWALPTPLWCFVELRFIGPRVAALSRPTWRALPPLHRCAAFTSLFVAAWLAFGSLILDFNGRRLDAQPTGLVIAAIIALVAAVGSCLWDARARAAVASLYLAGLTTIATVLDLYDLEPRQLVWTGMMFTASYALGVSYLWSRRAGLRRLCDALRMPQRYDDEAAGRIWLVPATYLLAVCVLVPAFWSVLELEHFGQRIAAAHAVLAGAISVGLLARGERRSMLQRHALWLGAAAAVVAAWSVLEPHASGELLNRAVSAAAALAGVVALYGLGFSKLLRKENEWTAAAGVIVPWLVGVTGLVLGGVLAIEAYEYRVNHGVVEISPTALVTVIAALVGLFAAALVAALVPGRDPLGLSERGRTGYVYAAEVILALLFLHIRLTMPWLFTGMFARYWPLVVMVLAFAGVALGELFRRSNRLVLSEPLERTGAFLPLLPVVGFWMARPEVHYSLVLLLVGGLYASLAVMRKSFGFGILATLAANGGLWYFLGRQDGFGFFEHPQLWLIPPALCVLVAGHLNRKRMTAEQATTLRYGAAAVIYTASTADIFLTGVAEAPYLPLVLAAFAIAGMLAGIALRIRAFLYLGLTFLLLALATIIWHAGYNLDRTWIFYVVGIVSGVLIIALFAVFEKKREDILHVVEKLKTWE